eukprot:TRINITY_DN604_c1_g1_i4.p1 TRINITY_DN604_c1_g1~~TRINITY_DN604_c1_g1_i4.p1  ORF type:complete len:226 (+),score=47.61 TRINITY_DN604_c1_g1_i4:177-854(+)
MAVDLTIPGKVALHFDTERRPRVSWTQKGSDLAIIVKIPGATNIDVKVKTKRVDVSLKGQDGTTFVAGLDLSGKVLTAADTWSQVTRKGSIKILLKKAEGHQDDWDTLVSTPYSQTKSWLEYNWDAHDEIPEDDVEPDEKEQPDVEPLKRRRPDENNQVETEEQKKERWKSQKEAQAAEAQELLKKVPRKTARLQFTCAQLGTLMGIVALGSAIFTHFLTRFLLA